MAQNTLRIFLAVVAACCPIGCGLGACAPAEGSEVDEPPSQACCCCHAQAQDAPRSEGPGDQEPLRPCDDTGCGICQCVCGGAIIKPCAGAATHHGMSHFVADDSPLHVLSRQFSHVTAPHSGNADPGCRLCILHQSMLL